MIRNVMRAAPAGLYDWYQARRRITESTLRHSFCCDGWNLLGGAILLIRRSLIRLALPAILVGTVTTGSACDSPSSGATSLTPQDLIGAYFLESVRGSPLPISLDQGISTTYEVVLRLEANERFTVTSDSNNCPAGGRLCGEHHFGFSGQWLLLYDGTLDFHSGFMNNAILGSKRGVVEGETIVLDSIFVYRRVNPAVQVRSIDIRPDSMVLTVGLQQNIFATTTPYSPTLTIVVRDTTVAVLQVPAIRARARGVTYAVAISGVARDSTKIIVN
jgi:hypothetical protein